MKKKVIDCTVWDLIAYCEQRDGKYGYEHCCKGCQFFNKEKNFCPVNELYVHTLIHGKKIYEEIDIDPYTHG